MKNLRLFCSAILAATFIASVVGGACAIDMPAPLTSAEAQTLSPSAAVIYKQAFDEIDHTRYESGLKTLSQAAEIDTQHIPLQIYNAQTHFDRAFIESGDRAKDFYNIALKSVNNVLENPASRTRDLRAAQALKDQIAEHQDNVDNRDLKRKNLKEWLRQQVAEETADHIEALRIQQQRLSERRSQMETQRREMEQTLRLQGGSRGGMGGGMIGGMGGMMGGGGMGGRSSSSSSGGSSRGSSGGSSRGSSNVRG